MSDYKKILNNFVDAHNEVIAAGNPTPAQRGRQAFTAMLLLEASKGSGGDEGELDFDTLLREAGNRFNADIHRAPITVAVPDQLADGARFAADHAEAVAAAEARSQAQTDQTIAVASSVVKAVAGLVATAAI